MNTVPHHFTLDSHQNKGDERAITRPIIGVIYNPRSHLNQGRDLVVEKNENIHIVQPKRRGDIEVALREFQALGVQYLIINGGDGTVRDVLSRGLEVFGFDWPEIAVLPKGKTNALNIDLGAPKDWTLERAIKDWDSAPRIIRHPMLVKRLVGPPADDMWPGAKLGFILGMGGYRHGVAAGQSAHKLGAFNGLAVGLAALWGVLQCVFGSNSNKWRRGDKMEITLAPNDEPLPHSGRGFEGRRSVVLASTLERFPAGIKLFGHLKEGLKLTVLDSPRRHILAALPAILYGLAPRDMTQSGLHRVTTEGFSFTMDDGFILDGEEYPGGTYEVSYGPALRFIVP